MSENEEDEEDSDIIDFHANKNKKHIDLCLAQQQASIEYYKLSKMNFKNYQERQRAAKLRKKMMRGPERFGYNSGIGYAI